MRFWTHALGQCSPVETNPCYTKGAFKGVDKAQTVCLHRSGNQGRQGALLGLKCHSYILWCVKEKQWWQYPIFRAFNSSHKMHYDCFQWTRIFKSKILKQKKNSFNIVISSAFYLNMGMVLLTWKTHNYLCVFTLIYFTQEDKLSFFIYLAPPPFRPKFDEWKSLHNCSKLMKLWRMPSKHYYFYLFYFFKVLFIYF